MGDTGTWCLIESDPGVFSELISDLGVKGVQVEEIYSLDDYSLSQLKPVHGLVFLFKWTGEKDTRPCEPDFGTVFFARQVITNACATQAILSILLNSKELDLGEELGSFREFAQEFDSETKGLAIGNSDKIRTVHNSFARAEALSFEDNQKGGKKEDAFHFISYLPVNGHLYELDGLKNGPINLGPCTDEDWLSKVAPVIEERMRRYQEGSSEIRFNLMALIKDRAVTSQEAIDSLEKRLALVEAKLNQVVSGNPVEGGDGLPSTAEDLVALQLQLRDEKSGFEQTLTFEALKRQQYAKENERRKHNFIPLIVNLLTLMAERGQLTQAAEKSKEKTEGTKKK